MPVYRHRDTKAVCDTDDPLWEEIEPAEPTSPERGPVEAYLDAELAAGRGWRFTLPDDITWDASDRTLTEADARQLAAEHDGATVIRWGHDAWYPDGVTRDDVAGPDLETDDQPVTDEP